MNTNSISQKQIKKFKNLIIAASIAIPLVVVVLFGVKIPDVDLGFLPPIYAGINGLTAVLLVVALLAIKNKNQKLHELMIRISLVLSLLFLGCYVAYHMTSDSTPFGGVGFIAYVYYFILISHILLSVAVIPLVLFTYLFAWQGDFVKHKKWTRFAWPIWFYVAVTGVIVYLMISPYYA
jgi:putative membrane protein